MGTPAMRGVRRGVPSAASSVVLVLRLVPTGAVAATSAAATVAGPVPDGPAGQSERSSLTTRQAAIARRDGQRGRGWPGAVQPIELDRRRPALGADGRLERLLAPYAGVKRRSPTDGVVLGVGAQQAGRPRRRRRASRTSTRAVAACSSTTSKPTSSELDVGRGVRPDGPAPASPGTPAPTSARDGDERRDAARAPGAPYRSARASCEVTPSMLAP